jgi:hypothetical protein
LLPQTRILTNLATHSHAKTYSGAEGQTRQQGCVPLVIRPPDSFTGVRSICVLTSRPSRCDMRTSDVVTSLESRPACPCGLQLPRCSAPAAAPPLQRPRVPLRGPAGRAARACAPRMHYMLLHAAPPLGAAVAPLQWPRCSGPTALHATARCAAAAREYGSTRQRTIRQQRVLVAA